MAVITAGLTPGNWDVGATWVGGSAPTSGDDAVIPATAVVTIAAATTVQCRSLTVAASGTLAGAAITSILNIGDGTPGAGNVALSISATATITNTALWFINFISTSATQQTITTNSRPLPQVVFNGAGGSWILGSALTSGTTGAHTLTAGSLDTGNFNMTGNGFICSSALTRSLTLGSSTMTYLSSGTIWSFSPTGLTFSSGTSNISLTAVTGTATMGALTYNNVTLNAGTSGAANMNLNASGATFNNLTMTCGATKTATITDTTSGVTVNGVFLITGNSALNRLFLISNTLGTTRTITVNGSHGAHTFADFRDITIAGSAGALTGTSLGDSLGNSGITFTTPVTQTATGTASFTWSTHGWTTRVPLPQDDVVINNSFIAGRTITVDMPRIGKNIDMSGATGAPGISWALAITSYGNIVMASSLNPAGGTNQWILEGRGSQTITNNSVVWGSATRQNINSFGGSYTLTDNYVQVLNGSPSVFFVSAGTFDSANFNMTLGQLQVLTGTTCTLGTSTLSFNTTAGSNVVNISSTCTMNAANATFVLDSQTLSRNFVGGGKTYGTLTYTIAGSTGSLVMSGNNTFNTINFSDASNARSLIFTAASTTTVTNWNVFGSASGLMTIDSATAATHTLSKSSGIVSSDYLSVKNSIATGGATWYAGANSTNVSGNSGWIFSAAPPQGSGGLLMLGVG